MSLPLHVPLDGFSVRDDELWMAGQPLSGLVRRAGGTPCYLYSRQLMDERIGRLRTTLPPEIRLHYAIKANPLPELVGHVAGRVDGLDVASAGELRLALGTGTPPLDISFAGPGKRDGELRAAVEAGIVISVESAGELARLIALGRASARRPRIALRVNPDFELRSSGMRMAGGPKPFGIDAERVPDLLRGLAADDVRWEGLHIYAGSQSLDGEAIAAAITRSMALALALQPHAPNPPRFLNVGGGFGIPYFPGDRPLDLAPVAGALAESCRRLEAALPGTALVLELGRYLVGEAGVYVCRVIDRKISRGQVFLVTDGGLHQHLAASGNLGQVLRKNYPVLIGNRVWGEQRETASVVGPLCTPLDVLADRMEIARAEPGDLVVVFQSGAYGLTASPVGFLGHPTAGELLF